MRYEVQMTFRLLSIALALGAAISGANAQSLDTAARAEPIRAFSRLASNGIGYSVLYQGPSAPYRVKVVCTVGQLSATALCPSANYVALCPTAEILCR
jgi:hypothetical protein